MTQTQTGSTKTETVPVDGSKTGTIVVKRNILATVDELFDAWLDPESLLRSVDTSRHYRVQHSALGCARVRRL
jgi:hypothetical protein